MAFTSAFSGLSATNSIVPGQNVFGRIGAAAQTNYYEFLGVSNQVITAFLSQSNITASYPMIELYGPDGSQIGSEAGNAYVIATLLERRLSQDGTYQLRIHDDGAEELFDYGLTLLQAPGSNLGEQTIQPGETVSGSIAATAAIQTWTFTALSNQVISAFVSQPNPIARYLVVELYGPGGDRIASEAGNVYVIATLLERRLTESGTYQLRVHDDGGDELFDYGLTLLQGPGPNLGAQPIQPGETVSGTISSAAEINVWTFAATSNQMITAFLSQANPTASYPVIELYAPDGTFIDFAAGNAYILATFLERRVTQSGTFQLRVRDDGGDELFSYGLTLLQAPGSNVGEQTIQPGETVSGSIDATAAIQTWSFSASSNSVISAFVSQPNPIASYLVVELYGPGGDRIASEAGNVYVIATLLERRLTESGTYQLRVHDDGGNELFDYGLTLVQSPGPNLGEQAIQLGETVTGAITAAAQVQVWTFTAASNQWMTALLSQAIPTASYPVIAVYGPNGDFVASLAGSAGISGTFIERRLLQTGNYQLRVHDDGGDELFDYSLTLVAIPGDNPGDESGGLLAPGLTATNAFVLADLDVFKFPAIAGDSIRLSVHKVGEDPGANPFMDLFAPDGTRLGSGSVINRRCLTETGDYFVLVRDDGGNETYSYALALVQTPLPPLVWDFDHPYLSIFQCGVQAVVRWPVAIAPFDLEFTPDLSASTWISIDPPFFQSAGYYYHTNSSTDPARFFRLHRR